MKDKRIILAVTNDLQNDQRLERVAGSLAGQGARVLLIGRKLPRSKKLETKPFQRIRMRLLFRKGPMFYACYNFRLFLQLLFRKADLLVSNDLDTLPASFLASRIRKTQLVYDSHEYFTEVPELVGRDRIRQIWESMERRFLTRVKFSSTVSDSIAAAYKEKYGISMVVVRNVPPSFKTEPRRPDLLMCGPRRIIIYQGVLNLGRGLETMIRAMKHLEEFQFQLFGEGDISGTLKELVEELGVSGRVDFMGRVDPAELRAYTRQASLGISLEEDMGLNYRYALPNKLFDYIHAGVPVLVSDLPEMRKLVESRQIGKILFDRDPLALAGQVRVMMNDQESRILWKKNLRKAAEELIWENEEQVLLELYRQALASS